MEGSKLQNINDDHLKLLNMVCASLIHEPRYYMSADERVVEVKTLAYKVAATDPEFLLKLALYVRDDLNIRTTGNWLLAVAANCKGCHPFFKKYFDVAVRLPTDLLEVVTLFRELPDNYLGGLSLPTALRKAAVAKFGQFDAYQLAKYNKERSIKKHAKENAAKNDPSKKRKPGPAPQAAKRGKIQNNTTASDDQSPQEEKPKLTLKQLIKSVHIGQPADSVMCILGKKYPSSPEAFTKSGLHGQYDPSRAGQRMKLPTPETWETALSAKGNKHTTWQELLEHKKLPFMAMLRNLRNMITTGISPEHHDMVITRLTDEKSIASSRQLPWRFLSAYQAIDIDLEKLMNDILDHDGSDEKIIQVNVRGRKGQQLAARRTIKKRVIIPVHMPDLPLIQQYREAIDTAVRLSVMHNLKPISGKTVVFCDVSGSMKCPCSTAKLPSLQQVFEVAILLGLMLQDVCEEVDFRIFSSPGRGSEGKCHLKVPLLPNTILNNVKRVVDETAKLGGGTDFPYDYLEDLIKTNTHLDQFIILSDMMIAPGHNDMDLGGEKKVSSVLDRYRKKVNPNLLFVAVDLYGSGKSIVNAEQGKHPNDVLITGFSDHILRFIAERGDSKQLEYVQAIDKTKKLDRPKSKDSKGKAPAPAADPQAMEVL